MIEFLSLGSLFGLTALGLPLIVFFLGKRKKKSQPFPSLILFQNESVREEKKRNRSRWWQLILRMLFILFLVLALANPILKSQNGLSSLPPLPNIFVQVNNAYSELPLKSNETFFAAQKRIESLLYTQDPKTSTRSLIQSNSFKEPLSQRWGNLNEILTQLPDTKTNIYLPVINWADLESFLKMCSIHPQRKNWNWTFLDFSKDLQPTVFVQSYNISLDPISAQWQGHITLLSTDRTYTPTSMNLFSFHDFGAKPQFVRKITSVSKNQLQHQAPSAEAFHFNWDPKNYQSEWVKIDLNKEKSQKSASYTGVNSPDFYLPKTQIQPLLYLGNQSPLQAVLKVFLPEHQYIYATDLPEEILNYPLLVVSRELSAPQLRQLREYIYLGGKVILFPESQWDWKNLNQLFLQTMDLGSLTLPHRETEWKNHTLQCSDACTEKLTSLSLKHPKLFQMLAREKFRWENKRMIPLLFTKSQDNVLMYGNYGKGGLYLWLSPVLNPQFSSLSASPLFPLMMEEIITKSFKKITNPYSVDADSQYQIQFSRPYPVDKIKVTSFDNQEIPWQSLGEFGVRVGPFSKTGIYRISTPDSNYYFSVNLSLKKFASWNKNSPYFQDTSWSYRVVAGSQASQILDKKSHSLWPFFILLALFCLCLEAFLNYFFLKSEKPSTLSRNL